MISPKTILRHELIGLEAEVIESSNKSLVGIRGRVMAETRNTLTIGEKIVPKKGTVFVFKLDKLKVKVDGNRLVKKPEARVKIKVKKW